MSPDPKNNMMDLNDAIILATNAHAGQTDKIGEAYILHPLRVMLAVSGGEEKYMVVAVLHDVIEDTDVTLDELRPHYSPEVIEALDAITHRKKETRLDYYKRVKANPLALKVKREDVRDNVRRLPHIADPAVRERLERKYAMAVEVLWGRKFR